MRIRSIKPEFCSDEKTGQLSREARLHFIMLWMCCDKYGVIEYVPRQLAVQLYPYDDDMTKEHFEALTCEVVQQGLCSTFEVLQKHYIRVNNFTKHQKLTTWEHKDSKPIFTAKDLRKYCGSTAEVLLSEERRGEERKEPPLTPHEESEGFDCPESLRPAFEALKATGKMPSLTPLLIGKVDQNFPDFPLSKNYAEVAITLANITGLCGDPLRWLLKAVAEERKQKNKHGAAGKPLGGEVSV